MSVKDEDFLRVPLSYLSSIQDGISTFCLMRDRFWVIDSKGNALFYKGETPQCSTYEKMARSFIQIEGNPGQDVKFLEKAFIPIRCSEYDYRTKLLLNGEV